MFHSLRLRLLMVVLLVIAVVVGGLALVATQVTTREFIRYENRRGVLRDQRLVGFLVWRYARQGNWSGVQPDVEQMGQITGERLVLADPQGLVIADSEGKLVGQALPPPAPGDAPPMFIVHKGTNVGTLYVGFPERAGLLSRESFLTPLNRTFVVVAVVAGAGAILLILGLSQRIFAPVEALTAAARRMAAGDLSQRVEITSKDEIGDLARAFNAMADGLAHLEELRRNMVVDVAHELRTPLTNIRGYLEAIQDGVMQADASVIASLHEEAVLLSRLVDDLQELSLAEAGQLRLERVPVAIADAIGRAAEALRPRTAAKGVALQVHLPDELPPVEVDPRRIGQVLRNLLDNAVTHTPSGGRVTVSAGENGPWVEVRVEDTGTGIAAEDLPYIFERFYRADKSRSRATGGTGLGLSIAKKLVEAHGGRIWAESVAGEGAAFTFTLPASPRPAG